MGGCNGRPRRSIWLALLAVVGLVISAPALELAAHPAGGGLAPAGIDLASRHLDLIKQDPIDPATVQAGIVEITANLDYQRAVGSGTGIVLSPGGEVLTNNHVIAGANSINATVVATGKTYPLDVIGYDRKHDIALAQLQGAGGLPTAPLGDSGGVTIGEPVTAYGNTNGSGSPLTHESGKVVGLNTTVDASDDLTGTSEQLTGLIQIAADLRPGDSGGPLVNAAGQVIGLSTAAALNYKLGTPAGHGYAIPINQALDVAGQIRSRAPSPTVHVGPSAMLGVGVSTGSAPSGSGVEVRDVLRGGPAEQAGMAKGDVITAIDSTAIGSATTLTDLLDQHYPGDTVTVTWVDRGNSHHAPIVLGVGPPG